MNNEEREPFMFKEFSFAYRLCESFCRAAKSGTIAFAIGTGGSGKSSIGQHLARTLFGAPDKWAPTHIPVILVEADLVENGYFTSKSIMRSMVNAVHDPFRSSLSTMLNWNIDSDLKQRLFTALSDCDPLNDSEPNMRPALIEIAKLVGLRAVIVDEGNMLALTKSNRMPTDYLESLRRLADQIGCCFLLLGTIDMLVLMEYSGQLNRRNLDVHVERMRCETEEGKQEFVSFLIDIEEEYGLEGKILSSHPTEVYVATYGIPGEITGLIDRATHFKNALGDEKLEWSHIELAIHHPVKLARMREEADLIYRVLKGEPLKPEEIKALAKQRRNRMAPRRRKVGSSA